MDIFVVFLVYMHKSSSMKKAQSIQLLDINFSFREEIRIQGTRGILCRLLFLTVPPIFQYQKEKRCSTKEDLLYIENFMEQNL